MANVQKTNAERILTAAKIPYDVLHYTYPEDVDFNAGIVSDLIGVERERSFKTLAARGRDGKISIFVVPADSEVDLKKGARAAGEKNIELVHVKELRDLTGYERGSVSPIGLKKPYPIYIEESATLYDKIVVSGGAKGTSLELDPQVLAGFLGAVFADLV